MSKLVDDILNNDPAMAQINNRWYLAKPLNYEQTYMPLKQRFKDAWKVFRCKAIAVHYKQDEPPLKNYFYLR